jgi:HSP20 family molecular chaperone IbpA
MPTPRVTRLAGSGGGRVTFGQGNITIHDAVEEIQGPSSSDSTTTRAALPPVPPKKPKAQKPGIDYSKWDKIAMDASDDDNDEQNNEEYEEEDPEMLDTHSSVAIASPSANSIPTFAHESETPVHRRALTHNGGITPAYWWSQDRTEVVIWIWVPPNTKAKELTVKVEERHVCIRRKGHAEPIIDRELAYPIAKREFDSIVHHINISIFIFIMALFSPNDCVIFLALTFICVMMMFLSLRESGLFFFC